MKVKRILGSILLLSILLSCDSSNSKKQRLSVSIDENTSSYWSRGLAEINKYELHQERYGEIRKGTAHLIFVKEDFNWDKQVKADEIRPENVPVLKLNATRKFQTGVYPYSVMTSVFSPFSNHPKHRARKITFSAQEWCGQVYAQMNEAGMQWFVNSHSYFESEGDQKLAINKKLTEDELMNLIRLQPNNLPTGSTSIIPSLFYSRLYHQPIEVQKANILIDRQDSVSILKVNYKDGNRKLEIKFQTNFPHQILGWEEFLINEKDTLVTKAKLYKSVLSDYWNKNGLNDSLNFESN